MDSMGVIATSGLTVTVSPAQVIVGAGLVGVVLVSNAKSLLYAWHARLFTQLARHLLFRRSQLTVKSSQHGGEALFAPVVSSSYTPLLDIDFNLHKSNSTFFIDLDDNRTELMLALFKDVVKPVNRGENTLKHKMFNLGGAACTFKKAIPPFGKYEISSRILCWDQKWIYVVSHFTKPGSNKPTEFLVGGQSKKPASGSTKPESQEDRIYATAIAKYVFKAGRVTCSPESVMMECDLLPPKPSPEEAKATPNTKKERNSQWTWEDFQQECNKHLHVAQNFGALDELHSTFIGRSGSALYKY